jgi:hypothetical protein
MEEITGGQHPPCVNQNYRCYGEPGFSTVIGKQIRVALRDGIHDEIHQVIQTAIKELHVLSTDESEYVRVLWAREKRAQERWEKIKVHVMGWGIVALVGWIGALALQALEHWRGQP